MSAEKSVLIPVSVEEAFALITEPERLRRWMTVSARVDLRAGGAYRWTVVPGHIAAGTFKEIEPGRRIVFGFGWETDGDPAPDGSTVTITVEPAAGGTLVRLVHDGLTDEQAANHLEGWSHFFARLERVAAGADPGLSPMAVKPSTLDELTVADATLAVCQQVLRGVTPADLTRPTPCTEYDVAGLVDHLVGSMRTLAGAVGVDIGRSDAGTVEARVADAGQQTMEAWHRHGLDGQHSMVKLGGNEMPATFAASILSVEFLVHAWDLAVATGAQVTTSDEVVGFVRERAENLIPPGRARGAFAEAVEVGAGASALDRLVAFSGRPV
jgi:uncharacterized protein (TIGR03086 family)